MITVSVERTNATEKEARIEVSADEVALAFANAKNEVDDLKKRPLGEKQLGADPAAAEANAMAVRATKALVESACSQAVQDEDIRVTANPRIDIDVLAEEGQDFAFTAQFTVVPEFVLKDFSALEVHIPVEPAVSQEDIDARLSVIQERSAAEEKHSARPISGTDAAKISFTSTIDGNDYEGSNAQDYLYHMGSGDLPGEFEDGLLGMKAGDRKTIEFAIPEDFPNGEIAGRQACFEVEVIDVTAKPLPVINDAFAQSLGYRGMAVWREKLKDDITREKEAIDEINKEKMAREALAGHLADEVPRGMIDAQAVRMFESFKQELAGQGVDFNEYCRFINSTEKQIREEMHESAGAMLRENLALEALYRTLGHSISDTDLERTAEVLSIENGLTEPLQLKDQSDEQMSALREMTMHRIATEWLLGNTTFVEETRE